MAGGSRVIFEYRATELPARNVMSCLGIVKVRGGGSEFGAQGKGVPMQFKNEQLFRHLIPGFCEKQIGILDNRGFNQLVSVSRHMLLKVGYKSAHSLTIKLVVD